MTSRPEPPHGTPARYQGNRTGTRPPCHCRPCTTAHNRAGQLRALAHLEGRPPRVPSAPAREHVHSLLAAGMSCSQIGIAANVSRTAVVKIANGSTPKLNRTTSDKVLAVRPCTVRPSDRVPALGTRRRLQALYVIGHGSLAIEAATGLTGSSIRRILHSRSTAITAATHEAIKHGYRVLCASPGSNKAVMSRARAAGWLGPAAWDDIDDPAAQPERGEAEPLKPVSMRPDVEHLLRAGESAANVQARTGASHSYIRGIATELAGRPRIRKQSSALAA